MLRLINICLLGCLLLATQALAVGLMPTPILKNVRITADAAFDQAAGTYTYSYTVTNPASNTGEIWDIKIDVSADASTNGMANRTWGLTLPSGIVREDFAAELIDLVATNNHYGEPLPIQVQTIVPFGLNVPQGWFGDLEIHSVASFHSGDKAINIIPGSSLGGFQLISYGAPTIRNAQLTPAWMLVVENEDDASIEDRYAAAQIEQDIIFHTVSLGPSGVSYGSFAHWNQLSDDLMRAKQLGWLIDPALVDTLRRQLTAARQARDAKDWPTVKTLLQPMLNTIKRSTPSQRTSEGYALVYLNVQSLINNTPNSPSDLKISLTSQSPSLPIGSSQKLSATLINTANRNEPLVGIPIHFTVRAGPNAGTVLGNALTDLQGIATIAYTSTQTGTDDVTATALLWEGEVTLTDKGAVIWSGGADLVVSFFSPPPLINKGENRLYLSEETTNIGNVATPASLTRYYISSTPIQSVAGLQNIGARAIVALPPGKVDRTNQQLFHIPAKLVAGTYYLAACADDNNLIAELDEKNNCSFSTIEIR